MQVPDREVAGQAVDHHHVRSSPTRWQWILIPLRSNAFIP